MTVSLNKTSSKFPGRLSRLLLAVTVLNIFDLVSTYWLVSLHGNAIEFNPLMRILFEVSPAAAASFKLALLASYLILIPLAARKNYSFAYRGTQVVVVIYSLAAVAHLVFYYQHALLW